MTRFILFLLTTGITNYQSFSTAITTSTAPSQPRPSLISEGALHGIQTAPSSAAKPGSTPGFYNPKRRVGRDFVVLSVAHWLANEATHVRPYPSSDNELRPAGLLDAMFGGSNAFNFINLIMQ